MPASNQPPHSSGIAQNYVNFSSISHKYQVFDIRNGFRIMRLDYLASGLAVILLGIGVTLWAYGESLNFQSHIESSSINSPGAIAQLEVARVSVSLMMLGAEAFSAFGVVILVYGLVSKKNSAKVR